MDTIKPHVETKPPMVSALESIISETAFNVCFRTLLAPLDEGCDLGQAPREVEGRIQGRAAQVHPIKPKLKPPGTKRLKLNCDILLSTSAFKFNLRRYNKGKWLGYHATEEAAVQAYDNYVKVRPQVDPRLTSG